MEKLAFCVEDNGIGIKPEYARQVFGISRKSVERAYVSGGLESVWRFASASWNATADGSGWSRPPQGARGSCLRCRRQQPLNPRITTLRRLQSVSKLSTLGFRKFAHSRPSGTVEFCRMCCGNWRLRLS